MMLLSSFRYLVFFFAALLSSWLGVKDAWALKGEDFLALCSESGPEAIRAVRQALEEGAEVNYSGPGGLRPLMVFVGSHNETELEAAAVLKIFLSAGAEVNARSDDGATALSYAVLRQSGPRLISILLRQGADPNLGVSSRGGLTPLMIAAGVEPDPLVSALLIAAGANTDLKAERQGQSIGLKELAERNPNPKVRRFIEAIIKKGPPEEGLPLFAEAPVDQTLRIRLKNLDQRIRERLNKGDWLAWLGYIKWQLEVDAAADLRRSVFGNTVFDAWINEYIHFLETLEESASPSALAVKSDAVEPKLIFQSDWDADDYAHILAVAERKIIVISRPRQGAVMGYLRDTGREIWRYQPSALSGLDFFKGPDNRELLLAASHWGGGFGDAALLDARSGAALLELPALDNPVWTLSPDGGSLIVCTDYSLNIFDLRSDRLVSKSWFELLEVKPWPEALAQAREEQNQMLAPMGLNLTEDGLFSSGGKVLFRPDISPDPGMLKQSRQALAAHNYLNLDPLAVAPFSGGNNFILGSACGESCGTPEAATPLFLVDKMENLVDGLSVEGQLLTVGQVAWSERNGHRRPQLYFSPEGDLLAVSDVAGDLHFFSVHQGGRHLGSLPASSLVDEDAGHQLKDYDLAAVLDGAANGKLLCALIFKADLKASPLMVEVDPIKSRLVKGFGPLPGRLKRLSAFAADETDVWAAALTDGELWLVRPKEGSLKKIKSPSQLDWTALALAAKGSRLLAAEKNGGIFIFDQGRESRRLNLPVKSIRHMVMDNEGAYAWLAADEYNHEGRSVPALALVDLNGRKEPIVRPLAGRALSLTYSASANYAVAVEDSPADGFESQSAALPVSRWNQGRTDIVKYDHRQSQYNGESFYDARKIFIGLSPDRSTLLFQRLSQSQAFVNVGRESTVARETSDLDSSFYQARLGTAAFSNDGRLALLPEAGGGNIDESWPYKIGGAFYLFDLLSGREVGAMTERRYHPEGLAGAVLVEGGRKAVTAGWDGSIRLWDLSRARAENILTWAWLEDGNWVASSRDGRFDTSDLNGLTGLHWVSSGLTVGLESFRDYYQPLLSGYVLNDNPLTPLAAVTPEILIQPQVKIVSVAPQKNQPGLMSVAVEVQFGPIAAAPTIRELRLYRDNRLVGLRSGSELKSASGLIAASFDYLSLPANLTRAQFKAMIINDKGVASTSAVVSVKYKFKKESRPVLWFVATGIDTFTNSAWNLNSAGEMAGRLTSAAGTLFDGEKRIQLLDGASQAASRTMIEGAWKDLGRTGPDDVALLAIFSRGFTVDGHFHFLPAEAAGQGQNLTPELLRQTVSSQDLGRWLTDMGAGNITLIIGASPPDEIAGSFSPGPAGDRDLALLAYDLGLRILCLESKKEGAAIWRTWVDSVTVGQNFNEWLKSGIKSAGEADGARLFDGSGG